MAIPDFYFGERSAEQQANQFKLKREFETLSELLKMLVRGGPEELVNKLQEADNGFRSWLDLDAWGLTANPAENAKKVKTAAEPICKILDVLDAAGKGEVIVVPETNSLLADAGPTAYRGIAGQKDFVFMLLPTVLGELDKLKIEHRNQDVREKAQKIIQRIKGWRKQGALVDGVTVDKTITVRAVSTEPDFRNSLSWLDPNNNDDRIIASVIVLQAEFPSAQIVLVSGDINLLNKADFALIETAELPPAAGTE
jgi:PIN domain